jgi:hypothetical protein
MKKSNDTIGKRSRDLPVCSAEPQPLRHRVPLLHAVVAGLLASSQYPEGPALTGHLGTGFSSFPCV